MPITLSDALAALGDPPRPEFTVRRRDGLVIINYLVQMPGSFDGIRQDFRGIIFDEVTGECLSRPLHKFYGVGQTEETQFDRIKNQQAMIFEKVDGSLIHFFRMPTGKPGMPDGELMAATRSGPGTPQALAAQVFANKAGILGWVAAEVDRGWTPIFEYCSPRFPIVVGHPEERLVYLCSRNRNNGSYWFHTPFLDRAERFNFRFSDLMEQLVDKKDFEGYVCWLDNGLTIKAKCPWYLERHRAFDMMLRPAYRLYELVFEGVMDDLIAVAQPHHKGILERIYREAQTDFLAGTKELENYHWQLTNRAESISPDGYDLNGYLKACRKAYVQAVQELCPALLGGLMLLYDSKLPDDWIRGRLMARYKVEYPDPVVIGVVGAETAEMAEPVVQVG